jgi:uncharacterized lipoprotein YehR (DUF1307 family)
MKKVLKCMAVMALVALAFTSCKKKEETKSYFTASTENLIIDSDEEEDRAYIDENDKIHFEIGDMCMLYNINEEVPTESHAALYEAVQQGNLVRFEQSGYGEIGEDMMDGYYAFYPGGPDHTYTDMAHNRCRFYVDTVQEYREGKFSLQDMYMASKSDQGTHLSEAHFMFRNVCGLVELKPYEAAQRTVTKIQIEDIHHNITGWVNLIVPEVDMDEMLSYFNNYNPNNESYMQSLAQYLNRLGYQLTEPGKIVTLNVPGGVQLGNSKNNTPIFRIVLRPLAMYDGFKIHFTFSNGETKTCDLSTRSVYIQPNHIKPLSLNMDKY